MGTTKSADIIDYVYKQPLREGGGYKWEESGERVQRWIWGKWGFQSHEYYPWANFPCFAFSITDANKQQLNGDWKGADRKCRGDCNMPKTGLISTLLMYYE